MNKFSLTCLKQAVEALGHIHSRGIVHRDLKLDNVMLCKDNLGQMKIKIIDFGLSKVLLHGETLNDRAGGIIIMSP